MTILTPLLDALLGRHTVTIQENERLVALKDGQLLGLYGPGRHSLPARKERLTLERHALAQGFAQSAYERALMRAAPPALRVVMAGAAELLIVFRDGAFFNAVLPGQHMLLWEEAGDWRIERVDLDAQLEAPRALADRITSPLQRNRLIKEVAVPENHIGLLTIDGVRVETLTPGRRWYWVVNRRVECRLIDLRWRLLEIAGQEVLTQDRVTIRVNLSVEHRVADPLKAVSASEDFEAALYRETQLVFRRLIGALSLDALLERKTGLDEEALAPLRARMGALGLEVASLALKDVILPGEMRAILNGVVAAEREAEANVIRRREETAATRSLLNTAKLMADNPVMLRLKELEALESIAGKVDSLVVHNGPKGLLRDIAQLSE